MTTFSIIVPLYNGAPYIKATLECVLNQTFHDYEIVVVDDGSKDNGAQIVLEIQKNHVDKNIKLISQANKGLGGARNTAIRQSQGELIVLLDQDDIWYPEKLEKVYLAFKKDPDLSILCHQEAIRQKNTIVKISSYGPSDEQMFRKLLFLGNRLSTSATVVRKTVFDKLGLFSEDVQHVHFIEDYDYWLRAAFHGYKIDFISDVLGEYVLHENNFSTTSLDTMYQNTLNVIRHHYKNMKSHQWGDFYRYQRRCSNINIYFASLYFKNGQFKNFLHKLIKGIALNPFFIESIGQRFYKSRMECTL